MLIWAKERIPSGLKIEKASGSSQENVLESSLSMTSAQILGQGKLLKKLYIGYGYYLRVLIILFAHIALPSSANIIQARASARHSAQVRPSTTPGAGLPSQTSPSPARTETRRGSTARPASSRRFFLLRPGC